MLRINILLCLLLSVYVSNSQIKSLYVGFYYTEQLNLSTNTDVAITPSYFASNAGNEKIPTRFGGSYGLCIGYQLPWKIWIETGIGRYNIEEVHKVNFTTFGDYKNFSRRISFINIPAKFSYVVYKKGRFSFSPTIGLNILVDRVTNWSESTSASTTTLNPRQKSENKTTALIIPLWRAYGGVLVNAGAIIQYNISNCISASATLDYTIGTKVISSSGAFITQEYQGGSTNTGNNFATTKGDAFGLTGSVKYYPFRKK